MKIDGPPRLERAKPPAAAKPAAAPGASYGLAAREVGPDAAIAASLAQQGALSKEGPLRLFALAAALQGTGRLTISTDAKAYALSFRRGTVEHAASSDPHDDLGRFLERKGRLTAEQRARAEAAKPRAGGDLAAALIAERLVSPADVAALLQEHGAGLVQRALAVDAGGWSWDPAAQAPPGAFPLGAPFAMLCAALRALDAAALIARLGDREHRAASRIGGRIRLEDLRLTPQETRAAGLFDGARSPAELASASPLDALVVLRTALLLGEVDLLAFGALRQGSGQTLRQRSGQASKEGASPPPPAPTAAQPGSAAGASPQATASAPSPAAPPRGAPPAAGTPRQAAAAPPAKAIAPPPAPPRPTVTPAPKPAALDKPALEALVKKLAGADHFEALGVGRNAAAPQIKAAYFQLAKTYHPDAVAVAAAPEIRNLCADVFARVGEAWSVLGDDTSRASYLEALKSGGTEPVDVQAIFRAENLFQEGTLLTKARRYDEAVRKFDEAIKLNPDEAEFSIWRGFCEFLLAADKKAKLAASSATIEAALKRNPRCAQGYLFLGQMAKVGGDLAAAERHLKKGLAVAPEHAELQRELKYLRK